MIAAGITRRTATVGIDSAGEIPSPSATCRQTRPPTTTPAGMPITTPDRRERRRLPRNAGTDLATIEAERLQHREIPTTATHAR